MGFFGSGDKTTLTTNEQVGASEAGIALSGAGAAAAKDSATVINTGIASTNKFGNEIFGNSAPVNLGFSASDVGSLLDRTTSSISDLVKAQTQSSLASIASLAETKQTDGANKTTSAGLWIGIAALAALAWVLGKLFSKN